MISKNPNDPALPLENPPPTGGFQQRLGLFDATMLVMGTMIGSGIFVVSAGIARDVGSSGWLMAVWVVTGVMTVIGALSYAELAAMMPHAGGQYVYLREAYSPLPGFLYGWVCFLVIQTGSIAAVAVIFAKYLGVFVPVLGTDHILGSLGKFNISAGQLVAVVVIALLSLLNCRGLQAGKVVQNVLTVAKTLAVVVLIVLGLTLAADPRAIEANMAQPWVGMETTGQFQKVEKLLGQNGAGGLLIMLFVAGASMTGSLFSADSWNNITFTAGEIRNPRRNLPLSLALGTGSVIVLYLLVNLAYLTDLPVRGDNLLFLKVQELERQQDDLVHQGRKKDAEEVQARINDLLKKASTFDRGIAHVKDERVGTAVLEKASPHLGVPFMAAAIMVSTIGCVNGMILMGARLYYAMAQDGLFFQSVGHLNHRGVPAIGLILQGLWSILLVFSGSYDELLDFVMFTVLIFYALTVAGLFILRWRQPHAERPYRAFGYPFVPALYIFLCSAIAFILLVVKPENTWPGLILTLAGIPVFIFWRWRYGKMQPQF